MSTGVRQVQHWGFPYVGFAPLPHSKVTVVGSAVTALVFNRSLAGSRSARLRGECECLPQPTKVHAACSAVMLQLFSEIDKLSN